MSSSISLLISGNDTGQRVDKFLRKYLPNAPLGIIFKSLRTGKIKVSGKKVEQSYKLEEDDTLTFFFSQEDMSQFQKVDKKESVLERKLQRESILYEDDTVLIINKDSGMNVHPGDHKSEESSLIELVGDYLDGKYDSLTFKPSLVHRIDRETSGAIMIAKNKESLLHLLSELQSGRIEKSYHAIVIGKPPKPRGTISKKLLRIENAEDEAKVRVDPEGQEAITHYQTLREGIKGKYSLIECTIETGRTHQIRVHMSSEGIPILGDKSYGNKGENSFAKREYGISRQLLHAFSLSFIHPKTKKVLRIEAPYKADMKNILEK